MNDKLKQQILSNLTPVDPEERYESMLDDCYGEVNVAGYSYSTSRLLKEVDPIAYRCGMNDYTSDLDLTEIDGDYYEISDCESERDSFVSDLQDEVTCLQDEIEEINEEISEGDTEKEDGENKISELKSQIEALEAEIEEAENYSF